ncbi:mobilisation protein (MobC) [Cohaesibacter gelatinilyticus]|uniref:Mobilisation protein (MobC) n=2 Tax=Cohaesibacter gelatinilyticus TaxID=372072 RepID=A0A285PED4_9HYPH|nr:mobilisation protein (MobC) [Cohaesibacter gelatinilyticus]
MSQGLRLSSDAAHQKELAKEANRTRYRRDYWQKWNKRKKRVFGTITNAEFADLQARAEISGRSVWGQVWAEACAYRRSERVLTLDEMEQQRLLVSELRRIGNNVNQLARLGHIEARKHGGLQAPSGDRIGAEALRQFTRLEKLITRFADGTTISVSLAGNQEAGCHDH